MFLTINLSVKFRFALITYLTIQKKYIVQFDFKDVTLAFLAAIVPAEKVTVFNSKGIILALELGQVTLVPDKIVEVKIGK